MFSTFISKNCIKLQEYLNSQGNVYIYIDKTLIASRVEKSQVK